MPRFDAAPHHQMRRAPCNRWKGWRVAYQDGPLASPSGAGRQRNDAGTPWRRWYKTARWHALRLEVFRRDLFQCRACGRIEGNTSQLVCDHVQPHRGSERLFWDEANLQTLCKPCHDTVKRREEQDSLHLRGVWY